jgi:hypothetical protein
MVAATLNWTVLVIVHGLPTRLGPSAWSNKNCSLAPSDAINATRVRVCMREAKGNAAAVERWWLNLGMLFSAQEPWCKRRRRDNLAEPAERLETLSAKLKSLICPEAARRIAPDLEVLSEAEGMALRPGPRQTIAPGILADLRHAILACRKVRLHYRARGTGALSRTLVCP